MGKYRVLGAFLDRVFRNDLNANFNDVDTDIKEQKKRVDDLIVANPQPAEVQDARGGFTVLRDRLDNTDVQLAESMHHFKPSWSIWEEFEQRKFNVKWFGAKGDALYYNEATQKYYSDAAMTTPATDDQKAFQNAVDFVKSIGGGTIYAPKGTYLVKSPIKWASNISLKGNGVGKTIFVAEGQFSGIIVELSQAADGTGTSWLENCDFEDFEMDGSGFTYTTATVFGKGMFVLYMRRCRINNLYIHDTVGTGLGCDFLTDTTITSVVTERCGRLFYTGGNSGGQSGIGIGTNAIDNETVIVSNCHAIDCGNYGIFIESQNAQKTRSRHARIVNCFVSGNRFGIGNKGAGASLISGCSIINNKSGIALNEDSFGDQIVNCKINENIEHGILVEGNYLGDLAIESNQISKNGQMGIQIRNNVSGYTRNNIIISGNQIHDNGYSGISTEGNLYEFVFNNNDIYNNGKNGSSNLNLGIHFGGQNGKGVINGNLIYDNQATKTQVAGIKFSSTSQSDDIVITNNNLVGYSKTTGISLGTGARNNFLVKANSGYLTENYGEATINEGSSSVTVTHGLALAPIVTLTSSTSDYVWVSAKTASTFTISRTGTTGALVINWDAKVKI